MDKPTSLIFQQDPIESPTNNHQVTIEAVIPYTQLSEDDKLLWKAGQDDHQILVTNETIFHPQGGGQPSDTGSMTSTTDISFTIEMVRMSSTSPGTVLHFGRFNPIDRPFTQSDTVTQILDMEKRLLYSRYHTAGHVLGAAVRHLLEKEVPGFDELKASHFPDSASCEFAGLVAGDHKPAIQAKVDEYISASLPVEIDFWDEADFCANGLERLVPDEAVRKGMREGEKFRVVRIAGAEVYPCGGTHVGTTEKCGKTVVKKISRSKGTSRVSYALP